MLRLIFGGSGAGKSTRLYEEILKRAEAHPEQNFLILVPDQFTMQTQMDVVKAHPRHAIMNIDVSSFGRLSHRVLEEVGENEVPVLDDTGKTLILRRVAQLHEQELPIIGRHMNKAGYVDEVKSMISEFMLYDVSPEKISGLIDSAQGHGALQARLRDLQLLYREFLDFIHGRFTTPEESMDILCRRLPESKLVRGSVIALDGFTGFTPVQVRVLTRLLELCEDVYVTVTIGDEADPYEEEAPGSIGESLFSLSRKTVRVLERAAYEAELAANGGSNQPDLQRFCEARRTSGADIRIGGQPVARLADAPMLAFLEEELFRGAGRSYELPKTDTTDERLVGNPIGSLAGTVVTDGIHLAEMSTPKAEIRQTFVCIRDLLRQQPELMYRDIAIICGNLEAYADEIGTAGERFDLPVYLDRTRSILLNPFLEFIRSLFLVLQSGYGFDAVFHLLRSGMTDADMEETDQFENYVRALGIRGRKRWTETFVRHTRDGGEELEFCNRMRELVTGAVEPIAEHAGEDAAVQIQVLKGILEQMQCRERLQNMAQQFADQGDELRRKEYEQIYDKVLELLNQAEALLAGERVKPADLLQILDAGFAEISVGTIPQSVDQILVGDLERSRLNRVKYLFILGTVDGAIPKTASGGGILSDIEREFLLGAQSEIELAPTPRQQLYIQRLYLYLNLTKPTRGLYLSCPKTGTDGKALHPSYLMGRLRKIFPGLKVEYPETRPLLQQLETQRDGIAILSSNIREYAAGHLQEEEQRQFLSLYQILQGSESVEVDALTRAAFLRYQDTPLPLLTAEALYGNYLENSVSRLEQFASCAYAHFLRYGLRLEDRDSYSFEAVDLGNTFHEVLEHFHDALQERGISWLDFSREQADALLEEVLGRTVESYDNQILLSTARYRHAIDQIRRILSRTVETLQYQLKKGSYLPKRAEMSFQEVRDLPEVSIVLTEDEKHHILQKMNLHGRIDRLDVYEDPDHVYVKVVDFKSGNKAFDLCALYYGLQLQLVLYMNVAAASEKQAHPDKEIVPAALLYYHVDDPMIPDGDALPGIEAEAQQIVRDQLHKLLRGKGVVQAREDVLLSLDHEMAPSYTSDVIPVALKKDGDFKAGSSVLTSEGYETVSGYVDRIIRKLGKRILQGEISVNPYELDGKDSCRYCIYRSICGFDRGIPGYQTRELEKLKKEEALDKMKKEEEQNG